ncbi:MAG: hypothetical protein H7Y27_07905, partial [Gemmatimonadaceae bacterium]|nr:hypothetical protein [Chitinophagaceae bacterium]
ERKNKKIKEYNIFYDCECGIGNKIWLQKAIGEGAGRTSWVGVTDTVSQPIVFDELVSSSRFTLPLEFIPITQEEKYLLEHGLDKVNKECCKPSNKPVSKFIGWVRLK